MKKHRKCGGKNQGNLTIDVTCCRQLEMTMPHMRIEVSCPLFPARATVLFHSGFWKEGPCVGGFFFFFLRRRGGAPGELTMPFVDEHGGVRIKMGQRRPSYIGYCLECSALHGCTRNPWVCTLGVHDAPAPVVKINEDQRESA